MHRREGKLIVAATDLVGFLECGHLTRLERAAATEPPLVHKPTDRKDDPAIELLQWRGGEHEKRYIARLNAANRRITNLKEDRDRSLPYAEQARSTIEAMRRGDDVIYQGFVFDGRWVGYPDFLVKVDGDSDLGGWHYEVADTKLARSAKASALIQICSYVEQIERIQGRVPDEVSVVTGGAEPLEHRFRTAEMMAYYRQAKRRFEEAVDDVRSGPPAYPIDPETSYPDPVDHCGVCRWSYAECGRVWKEDDALPLVASISRTQRTMLKANNVKTMTALSELEPPLTLDGLRKSHSEAMWRTREQARIQVLSRTNGRIEYEFLEPERDTTNELVPNRGLGALPPPSEHDLFFDIEGDPFAFWEGMEYLFGIWDGASYRQFWAFDRDQEKQAFEDAMDLFHDHWKKHPDMHVYHFGAYEPSRLKSLAGRHATRQDEMDELLWGQVFVDLFRVVRQGLRIGVGSYSIKRLEDLYGYKRVIELQDANSSIVEFEKLLEIGDPTGELKELIAGYNEDDCRSTEGLRDWLEQRRIEATQTHGWELPRLQPQTHDEEEREPTEWDLRLKDIVGRLTAGIAEDPDSQSEDQKRTWLLANLVDWHRREEKASWWRFFALMELSDDELFLEKEPIGQLSPPELVETKEDGKQVFRYAFKAQEHDVNNRSELYDPRLPPFEGGQLPKGVVDKDNLTLTIAMPADWKGTHPTSVVPFNRIPLGSLQDALTTVGEWVAENGLESSSLDYRAVRDLLSGKSPRVVGHDGGDLYDASAEGGGAAAALNLSSRLDATTLAIQGPPGSGKTYNGARMILKLVRAGRRVGVTGSSHKVITNLLDEVWRAAGSNKPEILQRIDPEEGAEPPWTPAKDNGKFDRLRASEEHDFRILAGTVWLWARDQLRDSVDTLFVDEAGQVALANVVSTGGATRNIVLLGDPQQLDQVLQGSHPPGAQESSLGHFLGEHKTLGKDRGVFLEKTYRMHPAITEFTSKLFYEGELEPVPNLDRQRVVGPANDEWAGSGVRWIEVPHVGNTNASVEEVQRVAEIWRYLVGRPWIDSEGTEAPIRPADILIVSPFNAHRLLIQKELPEAKVGTVDKFQGQQAAVSIYTMATSRAEDAPRGMGFLFSLNRLNVATSRAKALAFVVASPELLKAVPRTPDQLRMANGLAAFVEAAAGAGEEDRDVLSESLRVIPSR